MRRQLWVPENGTTIFPNRNLGISRTLHWCLCDYVFFFSTMSQFIDVQLCFSFLAVRDLVDIQEPCGAKETPEGWTSVEWHLGETLEAELFGFGALFSEAKNPRFAWQILWTNQGGDHCHFHVQIWRYFCRKQQRSQWGCLRNLHVYRFLRNDVAHPQPIKSWSVTFSDRCCSGTTIYTQMGEPTICIAMIRYVLVFVGSVYPIIPVSWSFLLAIGHHRLYNQLRINLFGYPWFAMFLIPRPS